VPVGTKTLNGVLTHESLDPGNVLVRVCDPTLQPFKLSGIACRKATDVRGSDARRFGVFLYPLECEMKPVHKPLCAKRHSTKQGPNDILPEKFFRRLCRAMENDFQKAFLWHMETYQTSIADLVRATGVSRDVINKLRSRPKSSTSVENGILIASYYGETVNQFILCEKPDSEKRAHALLDLLPASERQRMEAQIEAVLALRDAEGRTQPGEK